MDLRNDLSSDGPAANDSARDVQVKLYPAADAVGPTRRVSFGFPLAPGMLVNTANLRVTNAAGDEIPAFVRSLGAWRHMPDQSLLCGGLQASGNLRIRSALIQFDLAFASTSPVTVTVGVNRARTRNLATEVLVRDTFRARSYMAASDQATDDFFYSLTNQHSRKRDWPVTNAEDIIDFYTDGEPWLYDRAQTFYNDYLRTGNPDMLREAHRATDHYAQNVYGPEACATSFYPYRRELRAQARRRRRRPVQRLRARDRRRRSGRARRVLHDRSGPARDVRQHHPGLMHTHDESIAEWTRDSPDTRAAGRSKFRTTPPRKYLWQYKNAGVIGWALDGAP